MESVEFTPQYLNLLNKDLKVLTTYDSPVLDFTLFDSYLIHVDLVLVGLTTVGTAVIELTPLAEDGVTTLATAQNLIAAITSTASGFVLLALTQADLNSLAENLTGTPTVTAITASILRTLFKCKITLRATTAYDSATSAVASVRIQARRKHTVRR